MRLRPLVLSTVAALAALPVVASAANGMRPRTPVEFAEAPCIQTVTQGEVLHFEYSVPYDDIDLTADELPDSRAHQFLAFGRAPFDHLPPVWISQADLDRADQNGDVTKTFGPDDVLESSSQWPAGTWVRITADDARVPITAEQAAMGVDWDTTTVDPGTWLVYGYTWEPENNLWKLREGVVRIEDPNDPDATGPSAFIEAFSDLAIRGEPLPLPGCIEAPEGSTMTASWGDVVGVDEPTWVPFLEDEPVSSGPLDLEFVAPNEASDSIRIRIEITDPKGKTYAAYTLGILGVTGDPVDPPEEGGCRCGVPSRPGAVLGLGLFVFGLVRRRRRR